MKIHSLLIFPLLLLLFLFSCNDDGIYPPYEQIPDVPIYREININAPLYNNLNVPGGYIYLDEGHRGVIVYHKTDGNFIALERTCTWEPQKECSKVSVDNSGIFIACGEYKNDTTWVGCCQSQFYMDGNVLQGPASYPLKEYFVKKDGNYLIITN